MFRFAWQVRELIRPGDRVLDIGGAEEVFPRANVVLDIVPYESRRPGTLKEPEQFTADSWFVGDICAPEIWQRFGDKEFDFVLRPDPADRGRKIEELNREDLGLSYYSTEEIDLTPLIQEQVMLALPTRPLCHENCRGLCPSCGVDLNKETCACSTSAADPRMAIFRTLKVGR